MLRTAWLAAAMLAASLANADVAHFVRYQHDGDAHYGEVDGNTIHELSDAPYLGGTKTGSTVARADVRLLAPAEPAKVFAVGFNYLSHRGDRELPAHPPIFLKLPTTVIGPDAEIAYPGGASDLHYEAELVIVIGKAAHRVTPADVIEIEVEGVGVLRNTVARQDDP